MKKRVRRKDIIYIRVKSVEDINFDDPSVREKLARMYTNLLTPQPTPQDGNAPHSNEEEHGKAGEHDLP